jgi:hypothetical protein
MNEKPKKTGMDYHDISQKKKDDIESICNNYISQGVKSIKDKK